MRSSLTLGTPRITRNPSFRGSRTGQNTSSWTGLLAVLRKSAKSDDSGGYCSKVTIRLLSGDSGSLLGVLRGFPTGITLLFQNTPSWTPRLCALNSTFLTESLLCSTHPVLRQELTRVPPLLKPGPRAASRSISSHLLDPRNPEYHTFTHFLTPSLRGIWQRAVFGPH